MATNNQSFDYQLLRSLIVGEINKVEGQYEKYGYPHLLGILEGLHLELKKVAKHLKSPHK
tara:strand:+ start:242 stop:421 length:180 start_codon:yes stop_codon:yes gene_type:complete